MSENRTKIVDLRFASDAPIDLSDEKFEPSCAHKILEVFPDACFKSCEELLGTYGGNVEAVIEHMAENGYKKQKGDERMCSSVEKEYDFTSVSWETSESYRNAALKMLEADFPFLRLPGIRTTFEKNKFHYGPTMRELESAVGFSRRSISRSLTNVQVATILDKIKDSSLALKKSVKVVSSNPADLVLEKELLWIRQHEREQSEARDREIAEKLNEQMAEADGALLECGCCFGEYAFESIVQCSEGHLFCMRCLQSYAEQTVFGDGKSKLKCMQTSGEGCAGYYPDYMLERALPPKVLKKFHEAQALDALKAANLENLVSCFNCQLQVEMPADLGIALRCPDCDKLTCRKCGEESHIPLRCEEVEKKSQTETRLLVEEAMTKARLRECPKCHAKFYKVEGCNKMTCSCGTCICYICRMDISKQQYQHFCQTAHCDHKNCGKCKLYTDAVYDDRLAMYEAGLQALKDGTDDNNDNVNGYDGCKFGVSTGGRLYQECKTK